MAWLGTFKLFWGKCKFIYLQTNQCIQITLAHEHATTKPTPDVAHDITSIP